MDERIQKYLKELEQQLAGLPETERREAMEYYAEYINDALDEGVSPDELLARLDPAKKAAAAIKAETSIKNVRKDPGIRNYSSLVRYARIGFTRPLTILMFSLLIFTTYSIAVLLFLGTVISVAAACLMLPVLVYEALRIPSGYPAEIVGTLGMGIVFSGLMILTAYGFYVLCRPLFRLSANLISKMMKKDNKGQMVSAGSYAEPYDESSVEASIVPSAKSDVEASIGIPAAGSKKRKSGGLLKTGLIIIAASLIITIAAGLPVRLFMIFNSMKPGNITVHSQEFTISEVSRIDIATAHSAVRLKEGSSDKVVVEYEKPDWLEFDLSCSNGELAFRERSNGRLPLFYLVSMHESRTELTIALPAGYQPDKVSLESKGGFLYIENTNVPIEAKTYTGSIFIDVPGGSAADGIPDTVSVTTSRGSIYVEGAKAVQK
jgi:uncharacterized membrane protein